MAKRGSRGRRSHSAAFKRGAYFNPNVIPVLDTEPVSKKLNYPRNQLCPCGSKKKYKYCCIGIVKAGGRGEE